MFVILGINDCILYGGGGYACDESPKFNLSVIVVITLLLLVLSILVFIYYFVNPFVSKEIITYILIALVCVSIGLIGARLKNQHSIHILIKHAKNEKRKNKTKKIGKINTMYIMASSVILVLSCILLFAVPKKPITQLIK